MALCKSTGHDGAACDTNFCWKAKITSITDHPSPRMDNDMYDHVNNSVYYYLYFIPSPSMPPFIRHHHSQFQFRLHSEYLPNHPLLFATSKFPSIWPCCPFPL